MSILTGQKVSVKLSASRFRHQVSGVRHEILFTPIGAKTKGPKDSAVCSNYCVNKQPLRILRHRVSLPEA